VPVRSPKILEFPFVAMVKYVIVALFPPAIRPRISLPTPTEALTLTALSPKSNAFPVE
jgi:hypothetical protein